MKDTLLTIPEVSERTGIPVPTLRWYRHRGDLGPRSFRLGRRVVYKQSDVDAWIAQQYAAGVGAGAA
ncbi:helix-turn-helix transcriptional regulator [Geodermatophilus sp. SYSU D01045]